MRFPQAELFPASQEAIKVGGLYATLSTANPADELGYGVWQAFGAGRCLVGVDPADPDFDAPGKESGAKTVALAEAELPAHSHPVNDPGHAHVENSNNTSTGALRGWGAPDTSTNQSTATGYSTASAQTGVTVGSAGGGQPHNNVQPSIAVFLWRRTA